MAFRNRVMIASTRLCANPMSRTPLKRKSRARRGVARVQKGGVVVAALIAYRATALLENVVVSEVEVHDPRARPIRRGISSERSDVTQVPVPIRAGDDVHGETVKNSGVGSARQRCVDLAEDRKS